MDMPRRTNFLYATALTLAHTLRASANNTKTAQSAATIQLIHVAIRSTAKGGGALYSAEDKRLVAADARNQNKTTEDELASLATPHREDLHPEHGLSQSPTDWLATVPPEVETRRRKHTDVSQEPRYDTKIDWRLGMH